MTVGPQSRYAREGVLEVVDPDGETRPIIGARWRRTLPGDVAWHLVVEGESFETLADRFLGASTLWWRIADANPLVFPLDLRPGTQVAIPIGSTGTSASRTRSWSDA